MQELPADNEVIHQILLAVVSAAFMVASIMMAFLCGLCNLCKKGNGSEQKQPILGLEEDNRQGHGSSRDVARQPSNYTLEIGKSPSKSAVKSPSKSQQSVEFHQDCTNVKESKRKSWPFTLRRSASSDNRVPLVPSDPNLSWVQPALRRSVSTPMATFSPHLPTVFERHPVVVEQVQPDPRKLGKQSSLASGQAAFSLAQETLNSSALDVPGNGEYVGKLQFSIKYEFTDETLIVKIFKAVELLAKDFSGTSDPFVKVMLLPNKKHKMETKVKRKKLNPTWNETFLFEGFPYNKLQERILHLEVLDYDRFSRNDPIGELNIPLSEIDLTQEQTIFKSLTPSSKSAGKLGKILVSLCFAPTSGRITMIIMKCEALAAKDITGKSDPYVKIWHIHQEKKIEKKKTIVKYNTLNPVYNVSFMFHVTLNKVRDTSFVISVMDHDRLSMNDTIGGIILGSKSSPSETGHWAEMLNKPRTPIAQWHVLKDMG